MLRSHRSYGKKVDFSDFERKARIKKIAKDQDGIFAKLFNRNK